MDKINRRDVLQFKVEAGDIEILVAANNETGYSQYHQNSWRDSALWLEAHSYCLTPRVMCSRPISQRKYHERNSAASNPSQVPNLISLMSFHKPIAALASRSIFFPSFWLNFFITTNCSPITAHLQYSPPLPSAIRSWVEEVQETWHSHHKSSCRYGCNVRTCRSISNCMTSIPMWFSAVHQRQSRVKSEE